MYDILHDNVVNIYDDYPSERVFVNLKNGQRFFINYIYKDEEYLCKSCLDTIINYKSVSYAMIMCLIIPHIFLFIFILKISLVIKILMSLSIFILSIISDKYNTKRLTKKYLPLYTTTIKVRDYEKEKEDIINILNNL